MALQLHTPPEIQRLLADRIRQLRLDRNWKQATLATRAGISISTLRRYEKTGKASLEHLLQICQALGQLDEFAQLLVPAPAKSIAELERMHADAPARERGSK